MKTAGLMTNLIRHFDNCYTVEFYTLNTPDAVRKVVKKFERVNEEYAEHIMVKSGIDQEELAMALEELSGAVNLTANFGVFGTFLTTFEHNDIH